MPRNRSFSYTLRRNMKGDAYIHRSWAKMVLNPFLRLIGLEIRSVIFGNKFIYYEVHRVTKKV